MRTIELRTARGEFACRVTVPNLACVVGTLRQAGFTRRPLFFDAGRNSYCVATDDTLRRYDRKARDWPRVAP